jgi:hypothetical protein
MTAPSLPRLAERTVVPRVWTRDETVSRLSESIANNRNDPFEGSHRYDVQDFKL